MTPPVLERILQVKMFFARVICRLFSHDWRYNFPVRSIPSKRICARCHDKERLNLASLTFELEPFFDDARTDKQLIEAWFNDTTL